MVLLCAHIFHQVLKAGRTYKVYRFRQAELIQSSFSCLFRKLQRTPTFSFESWINSYPTLPYLTWLCLSLPLESGLLPILSRQYPHFSIVLSETFLLTDFPTWIARAFWPL